MGSPKVKYKAPPPDDTFSKYLEYTKGQERRAEERAAQERAEAKAAADARTASGASAYGGLFQTTQQQLSQGLIG